MAMVLVLQLVVADTWKLERQDRKKQISVCTNDEGGGEEELTILCAKSKFHVAVINKTNINKRQMRKRAFALFDC